ncbi:helix-turn-helix domain-containing protein [Aureibacillus halotolerans]|nr:helix-turn-helix transcriptional regulator [Aureibacillus halotolerans]
MMNEKLVSLLKDWMETNNVSKVELAGRMGVSESLVRAILNGERQLTAKRIDALAEITNIPACELMGTSTNNFAGYSVMLRGGSKQLSFEQEKIIMEVALLANDYEYLKKIVKL